MRTEYRKEHVVKVNCVNTPCSIWDSSFASSLVLLCCPVMDLQAGKMNSGDGGPEEARGRQ